MQDTEALIQQIEQLTKQNNILMNELIDVRKKLEQGQGQGGKSGQSGQSGQNSGGAQSGSNQTGQLANELKKLKGMVQSLESKMSGYVSQQSSGQLTQADVVNLLLTVMDGMIDWSTDFVQNSSSQGSSSQNQGKGQSQGQSQAQVQ